MAGFVLGLWKLPGTMNGFGLKMLMLDYFLFISFTIISETYKLMMKYTARPGFAPSLGGYH